MSKEISAEERAEIEYNLFLRDTSWYAHAQKHDAGEFAYLALGLAGEAGEAADTVKKMIRESGFDNPEEFHTAYIKYRSRLISELGDVLWYLTRLLFVMGLSLLTLRLLNVRKLYNRILPKKDTLPLKTALVWPFKDFSEEDVDDMADAWKIEDGH